MKNQFIVTLLIFCMSATVAMAQTKKPATTTKKPATTVKSTPPKTTTTKKTTTTTSTTSTPVVTPPVVEEKKTTTTTTTTPINQSNTNTTTPSTTTTTQSSGPSKGKKTAEPKPEKIKEPKPEKVREPKPERVKIPKSASSGGSGGVRFGIRAEASQALTFESGSSYDISPGVNAGLIINIPVSEKFSVQPEVLYSMGVVKASDPTAKADFVKFTTNSVLTPIILNFNLGSGSTKFMINPGGYANYLLSASTSQSVSGITQSGSVDLSGVDKFGYGAVLGLGVKINGNFLIETRAFYDLKTKSNKDILATLGIGYMF